MIESRNCIILPEYLVPGVDKNYLNQTREVQYLKSNTKDNAQLDENVLGYIRDTSKKLHVAAAFKKLLSLDIEMLTTEKQLEQCDYILPAKNEYHRLAFITVDKLLSLRKYVPAEILEIIENGLLFDTIKQLDYIHIPNKVYRWNGKNFEWYASDDFQNRRTWCETYLSPRDKKVLCFRDVLHFSNNRPLKQEEFSKIIRLLDDHSTREMAMDIVNVMNPTLSYVELLLVYNYLQPELKRTKRKVMPLMQEAYDFSPDIDNYTLDLITTEYQRRVGLELNQEQLEFIADNYYHPFTEKSSMFDFKLKIKKNARV